TSEHPYRRSFVPPVPAIDKALFQSGSGSVNHEIGQVRTTMRPAWEEGGTYYPGEILYSLRE
ncbi:MAG: hypothetical protein WC294_10110, partial [Methanoregula sp.]